MKKIALALCLMVFSFVTVFAQSEKEVIIKTLPTSVGEYEKLRAEIAKTPEGGVTSMVIALMIYSQDPNIGQSCLTLALAESQLIKGKAYKGKSPNNDALAQIAGSFGQNPFIPYSYLDGASPINGYSAPMSDLTFHLKPQGNANTMKIECSGDDKDRLVKVVRGEDGFYRAQDWDDLIREVLEPAFEVIEE